MNNAPCIFKQKNQLLFVFWRGFKAETPVESFRLSIKGMGQQRADACMLGYGTSAPDGILQRD
ncbi:MAG: hypothetical protein R3E67_06230 [Pseudomonadales bacterium]